MKIPYLYLFFSIILMFLTACNSSTSSSASSATTYTAGAGENVELTISYGSGSTITSTVQATVTVTVRTTAGLLVANTLVSLTSTLATLSQASVKTNSSGEASFSLSAGSTSGAGTVTATATVDGVSKSQSITYSISVSSTTSSVDLKLGYFATSFTNSILNASVGTSTLSAFGTTTITASVADSSNALYTTPITVNFSSPCAINNQATITSSALTQTGHAKATYQSISCVGTDTITATITNNGVTSTATVTITIAADNAGSIQFVSASPTSIALKGTGGVGRSENSSVKFKVYGESGIALANQTVKFYLDTTLGGISLLSSESKTDSNGEVIAIVQSGTTDVVVKVTAEIEVTSTSFITTQSDQLINTIGLADQNSITLSADKLAPEADFAGTEVVLTVRAADAYNHSVPDGTAILVETEGGAIKGSDKCFTVDGTCSVTWISHYPRPIDNRSTILAYMIGNETFYDRANAGAKQGEFDFVDVFDDLPEAFLDTDESSRLNNGTLWATSGTSFILNPLSNTSTNGYLPTRFSTFTNDFSYAETFKDYNNDGIYSAKDGDFNGVVCNTNSGKCPATTTSNGISNLMGYVRDSLVLIMASSEPVITISDPSAAINTNYSFATGGTPVLFTVRIDDPKALCLNAGRTDRTDVVNIDTATTNTCVGGTVSIRQSAPTKTAIATSATTGALSTGTPTAIPNTTNGFEYQFTIKPANDNATVDTGSLIITLTLPSGSIVSKSIGLTDPIN